jgi:hypothetical protein
VQDTFHVTVTGSFRQDTPSTCAYCDCSEANGCSWVDDASCPSLGFDEPDDNQQRYRTILTRCMHSLLLLLTNDRC